MPTIQPAYFQFFYDLSQNQDRDWFLANKARYELAKQSFIAIVEKIITGLQQTTEPDLIVDAKQCLFRINRDVRFSKDKRPYKEHLSASITKYGTKGKELPGHYLQIGADEIMIAGGCYFFEQKETLMRVRRYIADRPEEFKALIEDSNFTTHFDGIQGEKNKRMLPEFAEAWAAQPLLANTQFYWSKQLTQEMVLSDDFEQTIVRHFQIVKPLNDFFIEAMSS